MSWKTTNLGKLCKIFDSLRKPITKKFRKRGKYPYYGATGIVDYVDDYIFNETLVLIGEDGAKWNVGEQTAFIVSGKYWVNNHAHVIKPDEDKLNQKFLVYYLNSIDLKPWVTGITVPKLNQEKLKSIPIPLFSIAEQKKIVDKLDKAVAEIDLEIKIVGQKIEEIKNLFSRFLLISFEDNKKKFGVTCLKNLCQLRNGFAFKSSKFRNDGIPVLRITNIQDGSISTNKMVRASQDDYSENLKKYLVKTGDLLLAMSGATTGKVGINTTNKDFYLNQRVGLLKPNNNLRRDYLYLFLSTKVVENLSISAGAAQPNLSSKQINDIEIPAADLAAQDTFLLCANQIQTNVKNLKNIYASKLASLSNLKSAILSQELQRKVV